MKQYLFTAGPTPVPERIQLCMAQPILYHRAPAFSELFANVRERLKWIFGTTQEVITLSATGTGGMEAAIANLCSPKDEVIYVNGGKFGERFGKIAQAYGLTAHAISVEWGQAVTKDAVAQAMQAHPQAKAVLVQASETSTGVMHPVGAIADLCRAHEQMACVVDGITAVGCCPLPMDKLGIDVLITGSQKAFMLPPGLAMIALSEKAWKISESSTLPKFYFNLKKERDAQQKNETAWTPAISLIMGLNEALKMITEEGLPQLYMRHQQMAFACREAALALHLELLAPHAPSPAVTAIKSPKGIDSGAIVKTLRQRFGITIAGGQDHLKGKIFRLAHLGYYSPLDILQVLSALEMTLEQLGHSFTKGAGVSAAQKIFQLDPSL